MCVFIGQFFSQKVFPDKNSQIIEYFGKSIDEKVLIGERL